MAHGADDLTKRFMVKPGEKAHLAKRNPDDTAGLHRKSEYEAIVQKNIQRLFDLQTLLAANDQYAVLVVLQAMDAGGKDGTIRHVMTGLNPQGCRVTSFKVPTPEEARHDFLWRVHNAVPRRGEIGIFNRSHYEDVLVARVHQLVPKDVWSARYEQINEFEKMLAKNKVMIFKFFLHISREEQARRLEQRLEDSQKNWKISVADINERKSWDKYVSAYEDALTECSTKRAPWYVIPSNKKWFRNLAVSQILVDAMSSWKMRYPAAAANIKELKQALRAEG